MDQKQKSKNVTFLYIVDKNIILSKKSCIQQN